MNLAYLVGLDCNSPGIRREILQMTDNADLRELRLRQMIS